MNPTGPTHAADDQTDLVPLYRTAITVMTWGFRLSFALLALGLAVAAIRDESISKKAEPLDEIFSLLANGHSTAFVDLAILAMILTPVAAVFTVCYGFYRLGDRRYTLASLFVLTVLGISIAISLLR